MLARIAKISAVLAAVGLGAAEARAGMIFNITNQGGATPQMMAGLAQAGALWSARFDDPITINISIKGAAVAGNVIAHTDSFYDPYVYSNVRAALVGDQHSADDASSAGHLQAGPAFSMLINRTANNPNGVVSATPYFDTGLGGAGQAGAENNSTVRITSANAKALGLYPDGVGNDGIITFNTLMPFDFDRSNGINAAQLDFVGVAAHEIGHMLGFVSGVDVLAGNSAAPGMNDNQLKFVTPLDLFRFSSRSIGTGGGLGVNDWTDDDTTKYLSVDGGATPVATFSTGSVYEASHWKIGLGLGIMNPVASGGQLLSISENDVRALDVIGYNRAVPTPSATTLGLVGLAGAGLLRRRGRRAAV